MKKISKKISLSLLAMVTMSIASFAEEVKTPWYAGAGLTTAVASDTNCEDITYGVTAHVGYEFSKNVAVELRGIRTNWDYEGGKVKHLGLFVKPSYPMVKDVNLYGLLGYAKTTLSSKRRVDETGIAYGIGAEYALGEYDLFVDYEHLVQKSDIPTLDAFSMGVSYNF